MKKNKKIGQEGFSLIELAIALVVIGLILGGIFKGQELIERGRLQKTISQIADYQLALTTFVEQYEAIPGDFSLATATWGQHAFSGNQNGIVEGKGMQRGSEAVAFWQHLFLAGLIPDPGHLPQGEQAHFGQGVPKAALGGGFTVETDPDQDLKGLWMLLGKESGNRGNGGLLTPAQAMAIDKKLDNGDPLSGRVRAKEGDKISAGQCIANGRYAVQHKIPACVLYFSLQF
ncbi:MAG: type II secretion system protein [Alphaproteobacteria bacterium]